MEALSVTDVGLAGKPNFLSSLEEEVKREADLLTVDLLLLLLDKWENDFQQAKLAGKLSMDDFLNYYVRLKISLHHLKRKYERDWYYDIEKQHDVESRIVSLGYKTKEARRNYYVAKRRYEGEHGADCSCRGCRCLKDICP